MMDLRRSRYGLFYGCQAFPVCRGTHGAHADGSPLGTPAGQKTKDARIKAHTAFDSIWKSGGMTRPQAYRWLQDALGLTRDQAHIGKFDIRQCQALEWAVKHRRAL